MIPGEYFLADGTIEINAGRKKISLAVANRGDRPIQVGSHCHFFEVNRWLSFDRAQAYGMRLNIEAGTAVRFEPGDARKVELVALGGTREVVGINRLVEGQLDDRVTKRKAMSAVRAFVKIAGKPAKAKSKSRAKTKPKSKPRRTKVNPKSTLKSRRTARKRSR